MKFSCSKTGLKFDILAKLAFGPPYRFYANETYIYVESKTIKYKSRIFIIETRNEKKSTAIFVNKLMLNFIN